MTETTQNIADLIDKLRHQGQEASVVAAHQTFQENVVRQGAEFVHREQLLATAMHLRPHDLKNCATWSLASCSFESRRLRGMLRELNSANCAPAVYL